MSQKTGFKQKATRPERRPSHLMFAARERNLADLRHSSIRHRRRAERGDEIGDPRRDLGAETGAVEDAIVADLGLQVVRLAVGGDA